MLTKTIECLIVRALEQHSPREAFLLFFADFGNIHSYLAVGHTEGFEGLTVFRLFQQRIAIGVEELHLARLGANRGLHFGGFHNYLAILLRHIELRLCCLWNHYQAGWFLGEHIGRGGLHTNDIVTYYLQTNHLCAILCRRLQANRHTIAATHEICCGNS